MEIFLILLGIMFCICIFMLGYWFGSVSTNNNIMLAFELANKKNDANEVENE